MPGAIAISVQIREAVSLDRPARWRIDYAVANEGSADIWINDDGFLRFERDGALVRLSLARGPMMSGATPFGYFAPVMRRLAAGEVHRRALALDWPLDLSSLWNAEPRAALPPGDYRVVVEIGYAFDDAPPAPEIWQSVEKAVLAWQKIAVSAAVTLSMPPLPR